ncbi:MAG: hypothetical protein QXQ30_00845 [Candidatus Pacearchaeota archaeon]
MDKQTAKTLVLVIAILYFIFAALSLIAAIAIFLGGNFVASLMPIPGGKAFIGAISIILGIVFLIGAVIDLFVGIGLLRYNNVARIVAIVFSVLGIIMALPSVIYGIGIISLIINGGIFYLLTFQKEVVDLFRK